MLTNPYLIALGIPLLLILCGAFTRKLVRGSGWQRADFFLAVELSLATIASVLVYISDLAGLAASGGYSSVAEKMTATGSFLAFCFFTLLWVMATHQDWEKRTQNRVGQVLWLGVIMNLVSSSLLASFVLLVKGV